MVKNQGAAHKKPAGPRKEGPAEELLERPGGSVRQKVNFKPYWSSRAGLVC